MTLPCLGRAGCAAVAVSRLSPASISGLTGCPPVAAASWLLARLQEAGGSWQRELEVPHPESSSQPLEGRLELELDAVAY